MKFSQCPFKNIFHRLPLSNRGIYIQIIHVRRKAIFTFYGTCIAYVLKNINLKERKRGHYREPGSYYLFTPCDSSA